MTTKPAGTQPATIGERFAHLDAFAQGGRACAADLAAGRVPAATAELRDALAALLRPTAGGEAATAA